MCIVSEAYFCNHHFQDIEETTNNVIPYKEIDMEFKEEEHL